MKEMQAMDGPFYAPNRYRRVEVLRPADVPGFAHCRDLDSGEALTVHLSKLVEPAPAAAKGEGA